MSLSPQDNQAASAGCQRGPRFSIIMNVYNGAQYLAEALDSVMGQTFADWELIFWDDQSTDDSAAICSLYDDKRIRYFYAPRQTPLGEARELAIGQASGQWLAFLDQDDLWSPTKLAQQSELVDRDASGKLGIVYGRTMKFDSRGRQWPFDHWHEFTDLPQGDIFRELFVHSCFIAMSSAVLLKSAVDELGGIPRQYERCPDYYLYTALARNYRAACIQETCCWYRVHQTSMSNMSKSGRIAIHREILGIVDSWAAALEPKLYDRRRRIHQTLIGLEEVLSGKGLVRGAARIVKEGSLAYLLSRPLVRACRAVSRKVRRR